MCSTALDGFSVTLGDDALAFQILAVTGDTADEFAVIAGTCHACINVGLDTPAVWYAAVASTDHNISPPAGIDVITGLEAYEWIERPASNGRINTGNDCLIFINMRTPRFI